MQGKGKMCSWSLELISSWILYQLPFPGGFYRHLLEGALHSPDEYDLLLYDLPAQARK